MSLRDASRSFYEWKRQYKLVFEFGDHSEGRFKALFASEEVNELDLREFFNFGEL